MTTNYTIDTELHDVIGVEYGDITGYETANVYIKVDGDLSQLSLNLDEFNVLIEALQITRSRMISNYSRKTLTTLIKISAKNLNSNT